ncbi:MAG: hypothetical protein AAF234_11660 [Pseudomonadota bacterium]
MSWKSNIQLRDLADNQRLEFTCKKCGHTRYLKATDLLDVTGAMYLYLDEVESRARCNQRGCGGQGRLALEQSSLSSGFIGGMA